MRLVLPKGFERSGAFRNILVYLLDIPSKLQVEPSEQSGPSLSLSRGSKR